MDERETYNDRLYVHNDFLQRFFILSFNINFSSTERERERNFILKYFNCSTQFLKNSFICVYRYTHVNDVVKIIIIKTQCTVHVCVTLVTSTLTSAHFLTSGLVS